MTQINKTEVRNHLLKALPFQSFDQLRPHMEQVDLPVRHYLVFPYAPISHVCFIESGLASVVTSSSDGRSAEVRHVGREGFTGYQVVMGVDQTATETFMQVEGSGIVIPVQPFLHVLKDTPIREFFLRYAHTCETQAVFSALANAQYLMHERLARWLLMCHDRVDGDHLQLTHEFLSLMLGVRRSGVTDHLHVLEGLRAIRATRANIHILDRSILRQIAGGSYGAPEAEYERLFGIAIGKPA
jgi:CRP-like cAMP-binding protein